jgi:hypothetical protein
MHLEKIHEAAAALQRWLESEKVTTFPNTSHHAAYEAVNAIVDAVVNELIIDARRAKER